MYYIAYKAVYFLAITFYLQLLVCCEPMSESTKKVWKPDTSDSKRTFSHDTISSKTIMRQKFKSEKDVKVQQGVVGGHDNSKTFNFNSNHRGMEHTVIILV